MDTESHGVLFLFIIFVMFVPVIFFGGGKHYRRLFERCFFFFQDQFCGVFLLQM